MSRALRDRRVDSILMEKVRVKYLRRVRVKCLRRALDELFK